MNLKISPYITNEQKYPKHVSINEAFSLFYNEFGSPNMPLKKIFDGGFSHAISTLSEDIQKILTLIEYRNGYELEIHAKKMKEKYGL